MGPSADSNLHASSRTRAVFGLLIVVFVVFMLRAFYLQVIKHSYYQKAALNDQLKQYTIPAQRGMILAHMGATTVPIALNEKLYTIYIDPTLVKSKDVDKVTGSLSRYLGGNPSDYTNDVTRPNTRYVVIANKVSKDAKDGLFSQHYLSIGAEEHEYRTYPNGQLASQVLGFVNNDGVGSYGIEQALNGKLAGTDGRLKAVTDINGVPLAANGDNVLKDPIAGDSVTLTIDAGIQKQLEDILQKGYKNSKSQLVSALIMDPNTGAVKAMGNYPTYDPSKYFQVTDASVFNNASVSNPMEVGSIMKTLTTAAAIDSGSVTPSQTYYDPASWTVDGFKITNIEEDGGAGTKSLGDVLNLSLNTGATWELMQMSNKGGASITQQGRNTWYDYMSNRYMLGKSTNIEQGYDAPGYIPKPADNGAGIDLTYANTAFGQGMTATAVQMGAALSAVLNGGTYYQPRLVDAITTPQGQTTVQQPIIVKRNVVSPSTGQALIPLMEYVVSKHFFNPKFDQNIYAIGGKTGTAQIAKPTGGYYDDEFNGTYMGFVGGNKIQYVIVVFTYHPQVQGYAGTAAAQPIFGDLAHMLINDFDVSPKS